MEGAPVVTDITKKLANGVFRNMVTDKVPLNNNQQAVSMYAAVRAGLKSKPRKHIYLVPAGHGKSRITMGIVRLMSQLYSVESFLVLYNDWDLLESDREDLELCFADIDVDLRATERDSIVDVAEGTVVILDEIDD